MKYENAQIFDQNGSSLYLADIDVHCMTTLKKQNASFVKLYPPVKHLYDYAEILLSDNTCEKHTNDVYKASE